jgi:hypothetical protein
LVFWKFALGDSVDELLWQADALFARHRYRDSNKFFGISSGFTRWAEEELEYVKLDPEGWHVLLMRMFVVEFINLRFDNRYPIQYGLQQALVEIKKIRIRGPPHKPDLRFHHSLRFTTRLILAFSAHLQMDIEPLLCPWVVQYLRVSLAYWLKQHRKRDRSLKKGRAAAVAHINFGAIAAAATSLQQLGVERSDPLVARALDQLLSHQQEDGSWPAATAPWITAACTASCERDGYSTMIDCECINEQQAQSQTAQSTAQSAAQTAATVVGCIHALTARRRNPRIHRAVCADWRAALADWRGHISSVLIRVGFSELDYRAKWQQKGEGAEGRGEGEEEGGGEGEGGSQEGREGATLVLPRRVWRLVKKYMISWQGKGCVQDKECRQDQGQRRLRQDDRTEEEKVRLANLLLQQELVSTAGDEDEDEDQDEDQDDIGVRIHAPLPLVYLHRSEHVAWIKTNKWMQIRPPHRHTQGV